MDCCDPVIIKANCKSTSLSDADLDGLGNYRLDCPALISYFFYRYLPPSLSASPLPDKQDAELRAQVVNATVPCLTHLVGNRAFRAVVTHDSTGRRLVSYLVFSIIIITVIFILSLFSLPNAKSVKGHMDLKTWAKMVKYQACILTHLNQCST